MTLLEHRPNWRPEQWSRVTRAVRTVRVLGVGRDRLDCTYGTLSRNSDAVVTPSGKHTHDTKVALKSLRGGGTHGSLPTSVSCRG